MDIVDQLKLMEAGKVTYFQHDETVRLAIKEIGRLRVVLEDARHYAAVCPPPLELTGEARIEMLERRHRIGMAGAHEQRERAPEGECPDCGTPHAAGAHTDGCPRS